MNFVLRGNPARVMHHHLAKTCEDAKVWLHPRRLTTDGRELVYSKKHAGRQKPPTPLVTLPALGTPTNDASSSIAPTHVEAVALQAELTRIAHLARELLPQHVRNNARVLSHIMHNTVVQADQDMDAQSFRNAAQGFIQSALICMRLSAHYADDAEIHLDVPSMLHHAARAFSRAKDYSEAAMMAELALEHLNTIVHRFPDETMLSSTADHLEPGKKSLRQMEYDIYDFAANAWLRAILNASPGVTLRPMISRGILATYRGHTRYRPDRLFALYGASAHRFSLTGDAQPATLDWLRAIEALTRSTQPLEEHHWIQIDGYAQNIISLMNRDRSVIPRLIHRDATKHRRLSSLLSRAQPHETLHGRSTVWRIYDLEKNDRLFLQRAVDAASI